MSNAGYWKRMGEVRTWLAALPLAVFALSIPTAHADTDWIVMPRASESGMMMLHALRDNTRPVSTDLRLEKSGKIKSLRIGNNKSNFTYAGINYCGVAALAIGGDPQRDKAPKPDKRNYSGGNAVHLILRNCKTAEQGVKLLRDGFNKSLIAGGLIFFIVDANRAFVVECSPRHFASFELTSSICVYTNCWRLPNMDDASRRSPRSRSWQSQREWSVRTMLQEARKTGNTISVAETFAASRVGPVEMNAPALEKARDKAKVFNTPTLKTSVDAVLLEIDREFPAVLSCAYVAFGPQRYTAYLPVPVGAAEKLPEEITPNPWKTAALARNKAAKPEAPLNIDIVAFENRMLADFAKKREEARRLLREKKTAEAQKLLQENLQRQATELNDFLKTLGN